MLTWTRRNQIGDRLGVSMLAIIILSDLGARLHDSRADGEEVGQRRACFGGEEDREDLGDQVWDFKLVWLMEYRFEGPGGLNEEHERARGGGENVGKQHNRGAPVNLSHVTGCHPVVLGT